MFRLVIIAAMLFAGVIQARAKTLEDSYNVIAGSCTRPDFDITKVSGKDLEAVISDLLNRIKALEAKLK